MDRRLICFIHIERCGGTTLHHLLRQTFFNYYSIPTFSGKYGKTLSTANLARILKRLPFIYGIGGHFIKSYMRYEEVINRDFSYFTFIRNPVERYISQYNYILKIFNKNMTFDEYLSLPEFNNYIVKHICGSEDLTKAIDEINHYDFIGLTDDYEKSIKHLGFYLGVNYKGINNILPKNTIKRNKGKFIETSDLSEQQYQKVLDNNNLDIEFYNYIKNNISYDQSFHKNFESYTIKHLREPGFMFDSLIKAKRLIVERVLFKQILKTENEPVNTRA